ncbi:MAG TPA: C40 family peptidase [Longimicrobiales bacterium]|nr:C40 family peptidase [Longimicrobiales bacterium]
MLIAGAVASMPAPLAAQTGIVLAAHVGSSAAAPGGVMLGAATEVRQGLWGLRLGAGMDAAGTALAPVLSSTEQSSGVWSSDLDAGVNVAALPYVGPLFGGSDPTVFLAAGAAGVSSTDSEGERSSTIVPTWSYGARAGLPLFTWLDLELEARHRQTFGEVPSAVYPVREGWEYRAGLALRFGGSTRARAARPARPSRRAGTITGGRAEGGDARRSASAEETAVATLRSADRLVGIPYRWGGSSPRQGFDCSGFAQYVFREQGIELPRVSRNQARAGVGLETSLHGLARGDLLFFALRGSTVDHVAIYAGDGRMVHSSSSGRGVRYDDLAGERGRWYARHLVAVRRVIADQTMVAREVAPPEERMPGAGRALPLGEAFEALTGEPGDDAPPPRP